MEQMVSNENITNVLILLDPVYCEKSNSRKGGVGTETQIISPEIYEKVGQTKFIPIVFDRGANGEICKPIFLKGLLHFDLTNEERYLEEFQRIVKRLYGIEIYAKPELGSKPDWLVKNNKYDPKIEFSRIFKATNTKEKKYEIAVAFNSLLKEITDKASSYTIDESNYITSYKDIQSLRDKYLCLIDSVIWFEGLSPEIANFLEAIKAFTIQDGYCEELKNTLVHELFIYTIGILLKLKNYEALGYLINKTYFLPHERDEAMSFDIFYDSNQNLGNMMCKRDNKRYHCGEAHLWMETININYLSREEFIAADCLLYNAAVFGKNYLRSWWWFPVSYVYDERASIISNLGKRFTSKEFLNSIRAVFGYDNINDFNKKICEVLKQLEKRDRWRYSGAWHDAPLLTDYFKIEDLGKYN